MQNAAPLELHGKHVTEYFPFLETPAANDRNRFAFLSYLFYA